MVDVQHTHPIRRPGYPSHNRKRRETARGGFRSPRRHQSGEHDRQAGHAIVRPVVAAFPSGASRKDIAPFQLTWDNMWVRYDPTFPDRLNGEYCFFREERIFTQNPKILTRQTADRIVAALDISGYYALNTLHVTLPLNGALNAFSPSIIPDF